MTDPPIHPLSYLHYPPPCLLIVPCVSGTPDHPPFSFPLVILHLLFNSAMAAVFRSARSTSASPSLADSAPAACNTNSFTSSSFSFSFSSFSLASKSSSCPTLHGLLLFLQLPRNPLILLPFLLSLPLLLRSPLSFFLSPSSKPQL